MTAMFGGWGKIQTTNEQELSSSLQKGYMSIMSPEHCLRRLNRLGVSAPGILCGINPNTRTCGGDSGGPLVVPNYKMGNLTGDLLVGITSFGATNCTIKYTASFFTEISHFYNWIQENRFKKPCAGNYFPCISGGCHPQQKKCNKVDDCADGTDEINCPLL